jgi:eukaryotic-like serine/threonine-protein kinase
MINFELRLETGQTCKVGNSLGVGGQGEVFEAWVNNEHFALKWYNDDSATDAQMSVLKNLIYNVKAPNNKFLWPIQIVKPSDPTNFRFGFIMPLRNPDFYHLNYLVSQQKPLSLRKRIVLASQLCDCFSALHLRGYCYKDINLNNIFFNPLNANVLICDTDNIVINASNHSGEKQDFICGPLPFTAPEVI